MAFEIPGFSWSRIAGEDLSDSQFCGIDINSDSEAILPTEGKRGIGVVRNKPVEGDPVTIVSDGIVIVKIGATGLEASDNVTVDDDGTFIQATSNSVSWGRCIEGGSAGKLGTVLLQLGAGNIVATS